MIKEKDSYHDVCHNKSLAISFATGVSRHRLTITKPSFWDVQLLPFHCLYKI